MHARTSSTHRPPGARLSALVLGLALAVVFATAWLAGDSPGAGNDAGRSPSAQSPQRVAAAATGTPGVGAATPNERQPVPDAAPAPPRASFEELVERLVTLGMQVADFAQEDEIEAAKAADQEARLLFSELMERFEDAGEHGLAMLACMQGEPVERRDRGRCIVLRLVLATELARRDAIATAAADRSRIDPLVQSLLEIMPQAPAIADTGAEVLVDRPWLRLVHEPAVLDLVRLAAAQEFSREHATKLLLTLWNNLEHNGERSSDELSRLALMLLVDSDPSQRTAACRQLLGDARYRDLVLAWLRERKDQKVADEIASLAAHELPPAEALQVLRELAPVLGRSPAPYIVLGYRAPELLADSYRELLASNTQPGWRSDLITGIGLTKADVAIQIAQLALDNDPSADVRIQAMFALTSKRQEGLAERALQQVLDDPRIAQDPQRLASVVLALENLEAGGFANALDRVGQRLRALPLADYSRQTLEAILARGLPGGQTSAPAALPR